MRAVSLSNPQIISLLNSSYVPVYLSNEDFTDSGSAPAKEKTELHRIHTEGYAAKLSVGTVHAYILAPDGRLIDSMHTAEAAQPQKLIAMLERNIARLAVKPGAPIIKPSAPTPPACPAGAMRLYLVARYLERRADGYALVENAGGNWSALPSEDWIFLDSAERSRLAPSGPLTPGRTWTIDPSVSDKLLQHFYPPTENWELATNKLSGNLLATIETIAGGFATVRITGSMRLKHPFYHKDDDNYVTATLAGTMTIDSDRQVRALQLVTDAATYGKPGEQGLPFGVALRAVP